MGLVEADTPVAPGTARAVAEYASRAAHDDARSWAAAHQGTWPDACTLLPLGDVNAVFPEISVSAPLRTPAPIGVSPPVEVKAHTCGYNAGEGAWIEGDRSVVAYVELKIEHVARTVEDAKHYFASTAGVGQSDAIITGLNSDPDVAGLGDEARLGILNVLHIRKGLLTLRISVNGYKAFEENRGRVVALANKVVPRLP